MALPFGGPGGAVNLVQWNEPVSGQNNPSGQPDVQNRIVEQILTASGVDYTTVGTNFVGFSLVGHLHHVADIVDFPNIVQPNVANSIAPVATKSQLFNTTGGGGNPLFAYVLEDDQIYYYAGPGPAPSNGWTIASETNKNILNPMSYGAIANGQINTIKASDITAHAAIWVGTYQAGIDTWDFVALQEAIYAAYANGSIPGNNNIIWNGNATQLNKAIYIPAGNYVINRPLSLNYTQGAWIFGAGEQATVIESTNQSQSNSPNFNATVLLTNGMSYSKIENLQAAQHPSFPNPGGCLLLFDWDGTANTPNGYNAAHQGNKYSNLYMNGNGQFPSNDPNYPSRMHIRGGVAISPRVGVSQQGSENYFYSCHWIWCEVGYFQDSFNALQNGFIGGNMENCRLAGIWAQEGAIRVDNMGFQNDPGGAIGNANTRSGQQLNVGGYDIILANSAFDASLVTNCRSQSFNFLSSSAGHRATCVNINMLPNVNRWIGTTAYVAQDVITGNLSNTNYDGAMWVCTIGGTSAGSEPLWNTITSAQSQTAQTIVDGGVTWQRLGNVAIGGDAGVSIYNSLLPYCLGAQGGSPSTGVIENCQFTRPDWLPYTSGGWTSQFTYFKYTNNTVSFQASFGARADIAYSFGAGSTHLNPHYYSQFSAILFRQFGSEVGFDYGDTNLNIIGMYGWLGQKTPTGTNIAGVDTVIVGGLSTGSGLGGKVRLKAAAPGVSSAIANTPVDIFSGDTTGFKLGTSASPIIRAMQVDYSCAPGTIVATAGSNFFTQTNSFYGVLLGDVVEPAFTGQALPAGVIAQATVTAADKVRFDLINQSNASQAITAGRVRYAIMVRPPVTGVSGQSAAADIAQLQTDMGGAGNFLAMYDSRVQITGANPITAWNDIAGSGGGKGPTLVNTGSPIFNSSLNVVQAPNGLNFLGNSVASTQLDFSGTRTILFGMSIPVINSQPGLIQIFQGTSNIIFYPFGIGPNNASNVTLAIQTTVSGVQISTLTFTSIGIGNPWSPAILIAGYVSLTTTTINATIFDTTAPSGTTSLSSPLPSGANTLDIGNTSVTVNGTTSFSHFAILSVASTADQLSAYRSWCIAKHAAIAQ